MNPNVTMPTDPAFPTQPAGKKGVTIREYFSVMALQGLLAAPDVDVRDGAGYVDPSKLTDWAVLYAESLIRSLNEDQGELDAKAATLTPSTGTKIQ